MNDLSARHLTQADEDRLLDEALARVKAKSEVVVLYLAFYEEQARLLESLPNPTWPVDRRIELAWEIVRHLGSFAKAGRLIALQPPMLADRHIRLWREMAKALHPGPCKGLVSLG